MSQSRTTNKIRLSLWSKQGEMVSGIHYRMNQKAWDDWLKKEKDGTLTHEEKTELDNIRASDNDNAVNKNKSRAQKALDPLFDKLEEIRNLVAQWCGVDSLSKKLPNSGVNEKKNLDEKVQKLIGRVESFVGKARQLSSEDEQHLALIPNGPLCEYFTELLSPLKELLKTNILLLDPNCFSKKISDARATIEEAYNKLPPHIGKTNVGKVFLSALWALLSVFAAILDVGILVVQKIRDDKVPDFCETFTVKCWERSYFMFHSKAYPVQREIRAAMDCLQTIHEIGKKHTGIRI